MVLHEVVTLADGLLVYGITVPDDDGASLWGGYATHVYLHPRRHAAPRARRRHGRGGRAVRADRQRHPLGRHGARYRARRHRGGVRSRDSRDSGASSGRAAPVRLGSSSPAYAADAARLDVARALGASDTITVDDTDPVAAVMELTSGRGADIVVDASAGATEPVVQAIEMVRSGGTVILGGLKGGATVPGFVSDRVVLRQVRVQGVGGHDHASVEAALEVIASRAFPLDLMRTHTLPLADAERAIRMVGREIDGEDPIHVTLIP